MAFKALLAAALFVAVCRYATAAGESLTTLDDYCKSVETQGREDFDCKPGPCPAIDIAKYASTVIHTETCDDPSAKGHWQWIVDYKDDLLPDFGCYEFCIDSSYGCSTYTETEDGKIVTYGESDCTATTTKNITSTVKDAGGKNTSPSPPPRPSSSSSPSSTPAPTPNAAPAQLGSLYTTVLAAAMAVAALMCRF